MSNVFIDLALGVQAIRRKVEREIGGLSGAAGVAAMPYPHQLGNVQRILTDTRIRHLIADQVGLGKTVQALMVLNALRIQNPDHRALILVPENLAPQWWNECRARGHFVPLDEAPPDEQGAHVRLAYYEQLSSITEIDPELYDLLIVDEIQRLQSVVRRRIVDVAGDFRQILLLSATPKLEDVESYRQLLTILEPERMAAAARVSATPELMLREQERVAADMLGTGTPEQWQAAKLPIPPERERSVAVAATFCTLRRVINTRRRDYPDLLPQRVLIRVAVEPTEDEVLRQEQVWKYIGFAQQANSSVDLARLGQVAIRCSRALSERINVLRGRDQRDPHGYLREALSYLDLANGDSRLEALIDLLADIWMHNPDEAVLVVAEDNPTVDYLERQIPQYLPEIGPNGNRRQLTLAVKRNRDAAATPDFTDLFDEYNDALGGFVEGDEQLLIAADIAQVGLNLQHARKLIFFSMPWSPQAVEQWIGRLDRLGSAALLEREGERTIDVYAIIQRGQVDERVVTVLDSFGIFKRNIRLDGEEIQLVTQHIIDAALNPYSSSWEKLGKEARDLTLEDDGLPETPLSGYLPWTPKSARALSQYLDEVGAIEPLLGRTQSRRAVLRSEAGLKGWMRLMGRADEVRLWGKKDPDDSNFTYRLLHYARPAFSISIPEPRFLLPGLDPNNGRRYAYIDSRRNLQSPPVQSVRLDENPESPLAFLDHGNAVHEALIVEWAALGKKAATYQRVTYPAGHPMTAPEAKGVYLLGILSWIPGNDHLKGFDASSLLAALRESRVRQEQKPFYYGIKSIDEELRADRRWLNSLFTPRLDLLAARLRENSWELVESTVANMLLTPWVVDAVGKATKLASGRATMLSDSLKLAKEAGLKLLANEHAARHRRSVAECGRLATLVAARRFQVKAEGDDLIKIRQAAVDEAIAAGLDVSEQGFARSRFRVMRNARDVAIAASDARLARLDALAKELSNPRGQQYKVIMLFIE